MKISIITPVYNEEVNIPRYFNALKEIDYPKSDIELIFIDDCSRDSSLEMLKSIKNNADFDIRIIEFKKNLGRAIAREEAAKIARYEQIFFLDCKCEIFPDALKVFRTKKCEVVNCNIVQKENHIFDKFFLLIRNKVYRKNFGKSFHDAWIAEENFDRMAKGTTAFFCDKTTFLNSQSDNKHDVRGNDDIKLLWNIVKKKKILATGDIKAYYNTRKSLEANIKHLFNRGHTFVDYYHRPGRRYFHLINLSLLVFTGIFVMAVKGLYLKELALSLLAINALISLYLAKKIPDFFIAFTMFPFVGTIFFAGVLKKVISKIGGHLI